jgi:anti-sigma B factor antagonist
MHFTIDQKDGVTIFKLNEARLDSLNAGQLKAEFLILAQPDVEKLILDLSQVSYVDSAGLSALLLAERQQTAHGGDVRLVGVNENVKSLLRITQLDRIFPMYATVPEAIQADLNMEAPEPSTLGPSAPTKDAIRTGAIASGGSLGAAALAGLIMNPTMLQDDDDEDYDDDDDDLDDLDDIDEIDDPEVIEVGKEAEAGEADLDELGDDYDDEDAYSDDDDLEGDLAEEDDDLDELDDEDEDEDDY